MRHALPLHFIVPHDQAGTRLDAVLGTLLPGMGVRARRRLWEWCDIRVNGSKQKAGHTVRGGDAVTVEERRQPEDTCGEKGKAGCDAPYLISVQGDFALLFKPKGLHTALISGGRETSLEVMLPELWRQYCANPQQEKRLLLLTRLDLPTSGIVVAALTEEAERRFRAWERGGLVYKTYLAVVRGRITSPFLVKNALFTNRREKTVVREDPGENTRWTKATPLALLGGDGMPPFRGWQDSFWKTGPAVGTAETARSTLLRVEILRGARHQIRAHMAYAGCPLVGDALYGDGDGAFFLHHGGVVTPEFSCRLLPEWVEE